MKPPSAYIGSDSMFLAESMASASRAMTITSMLRKWNTRAVLSLLVGQSIATRGDGMLLRSSCIFETSIIQGVEW